MFENYNGGIDWTVVTVVAVLALIIGGSIFVFWMEAHDDVVYERAEDEAKTSIKKMGYDTRKVEVFLNATDWDYQNFRDSEGIQRMFKNFQEKGELPTIKKTVHMGLL